MNYKNIFRKHMEPMLMRLIYIDLVDGILKDGGRADRRKLRDIRTVHESFHSVYSEWEQQSSRN